ncbi:MAG: BMP family ABC transporter substrate-binding protein [Candidatus Korarchaeota archaeon]|nr:BMP family ABC transporter substrate-binding protein [Thermoproteota archaeon]
MEEKSRFLISIIIVAILSAAAGAAAMYFALGGGPAGAAPTKLKAAWIYVGPIGDIGWTYAHNYGRLYVAGKFSSWLDTTYVESVTAADFSACVNLLIEKGYTIIFATSFEFLEPSYTAALQNPNVLFFHCSGWDIYLPGAQPTNLGFYFAEFYQLYYLNGLMAGALTTSGKIGYVAAHYIPEVVRHINAFALGALEAAKYLNKSITIYVTKIGSWYNPDVARSLASQLVSNYGVDVIAFTEDSYAIVQFCQEQFDAGNPVYTFSHYSPMYTYGPNVTVSGQLVHWEVIYEDIISKVYTGTYNKDNLKDKVDYWWMLREGAVELGADFGMPINPNFINKLNTTLFEIDEKLEAEFKAFGMEKAIIVQNGKKYASIYNLVMLRLKEMKEESTVFDPFTGPIYDNAGNLRVLPGLRLNRYELWTMDWFVSNIINLAS